MKDCELRYVRAIASVCKALGHPRRIRMLERLSREDLCAYELQRPEPVDLLTVSRHLSVLRTTDLVVSRKAGTTVFYSISCGAVADVIRLAARFMKTKDTREL